jgi:hypothetical protein
MYLFNMTRLKSANRWMSQQLKPSVTNSLFKSTLRNVANARNPSRMSVVSKLTVAMLMNMAGDALRVIHAPPHLSLQ